MSNFGKLAGNLNVGGAQVASSNIPSGNSDVAVVDSGQFIELENNTADQNLFLDVHCLVSAGEVVNVSGVLAFQNIGSNAQFEKLIVKLQRATLHFSGPVEGTLLVDVNSFSTVWETTIGVTGPQVGDASFDLFAPIPIDYIDVSAPGNQQLWYFYRILVTTPSGVTGTQTIQVTTADQGGQIVLAAINLGRKAFSAN